MAEQAALRKTLSELSKRENLKNKVCCDCGNPNPQWASLRLANSVLSSAPTYPSFAALPSSSVYNVPEHIEALAYISGMLQSSDQFIYIHFSSFVRSISMDTWQEDQVKRMQVHIHSAGISKICSLYANTQLGGNLPFKEFMSSYNPPDQGGYKEGATSYDIYHCWAATQYREKVRLVPYIYIPYKSLFSLMRWRQVKNGLLPPHHRASQLVHALRLLHRHHMAYGNRGRPLVPDLVSVKHHLQRHHSAVRVRALRTRALIRKQPTKATLRISAK
jgi:hypothetical protein